MIQSYRPLIRSLLISLSALVLIVAGCNKKPRRRYPASLHSSPGRGQAHRHLQRKSHLH